MQICYSPGFSNWEQYLIIDAMLNNSNELIIEDKSERTVQ